MKNTSIFFRKEETKIKFFVAERSSIVISKNDKELMTYEEIVSELPPYLQTDLMVEKIDEIIISSLERLIDYEPSVIKDIYKKTKRFADSPMKIFLLSAIKSTEFSTRVYTRLQATEINSVYQILEFYGKKFLSITGLGQHSFVEINEFLEQHEITPEIGLSIKLEIERLKNTTYGDLLGAKEKAEYKELIQIFEPFSFLLNRQLKFFIDNDYGYRFFLWHDHEFSFKTKFKENDEQNKILTLIEKIEFSIRKYIDLEMKKFITSADF